MTDGEGGRLALFDLDGTLVDSAPDLADAVDYALTCHRLPARGEAYIRGSIGNGATRLIHRAITGRHDGEAQPGEFAAVYADFLTAYDARLFTRTTVYPGVCPALDALRAHGWQLGCVTNKPARFTVPLLTAAGLADYFAVTVSGDSLPVKKPDPAPLLHAAATLGIATTRTVMIGDSVTDVYAARDAGMAAYCVSFGYHGGIDLVAAGALALIDDMHSLAPLLERAFG